MFVQNKSENPILKFEIPNADNFLFFISFLSLLTLILFVIVTTYNMYGVIPFIADASSSKYFVKN